MIFSRWDPASGNYDYYESPDRIGLNDDLPVPAMPPPTKLGVPSVECGRPLGRGARHIGSGERAVGSITPPAAVQLAAATGAMSEWMGNPWIMLTGGIILGAVAAGMYFQQWGRVGRSGRR